MIISSERKFNSCSRCNGTGSITESAVFPWMPDDHSSCPKCHGKGKTEKTDYNYDKNVFNIDNIITIGEIDMEIKEYMFESMQYYDMWFYINGHIKILKQTHDWSRDAKKEEREEKKKKTFLELKAIRDDIINKLKRRK